MRALTGLLVLLAFIKSASAIELTLPPVTIPQLPASAGTEQAFVPAGWAIEAKAQGDLDGDGIDDIVLVIQEQNPDNILKNEGLGNPVLNSNPRILAVAVYDWPKRSFRLVVQNSSLIPRYESPTIDDAFDKDGGLSIQRKAFKISLGQFANAGGWDMGRTTFSFRLERNSIGLIGYDRFTVTRNTGKTRSLSINYLSGKIRSSIGSIEDDKEQVTWIRLRQKGSVPISEVGDGADFDPDAKQ